MKNIIGKWTDYSKAIDYILEHRESLITMKVEMIDGKKFYVLRDETMTTTNIFNDDKRLIEKITAAGSEDANDASAINAVLQLMMDHLTDDLGLTQEEAIKYIASEI